MILMRRGYKLYLEDIFTSINKIQSYIGNSSLEDFAKDEMKLDKASKLKKYLR